MSDAGSRPNRMARELRALLIIAVALGSLIGGQSLASAAVPPVVSGVSPNSGPQGTSVTITGSGFLNATGVTFGGTPAGYIIQTDTQILTNAPAHSPGVVDVRVASANGTSAIVTADQYTYPGTVAAPVVTAVSPISGTAGTLVTISGSGFTGATSVSFGGSVAAPTVLNDNQITVTAPGHAPGVVDITVTTSAGTSAITGADQFLYTGGSGPAVTGVSPATGAPGTSVVISGSGFTGATSVSFGGTFAAASVNSDTQITATAPSHGVGLVDVQVTTPAGTSPVVAADHFTYTTGSVPAVTGVSPASGTTGTLVTISGSGFTGATSVSFGGATATPTVNSDTQISVLAPAHIAGQVDVQVTTPSGTSTVAVADRFTYTSGQPSVSGVSPASGPAGTVVTITGTGFTGATAVTFGGASTAPTSVSETQIVVTAPTHALGQVDVLVTTPVGTSLANTDARFVYTAPGTPVVTAIAPTSGTAGTTVTITGSGFTGATSVSFGGGTATPTVVSDTRITVLAPAHAAGVVNVTVTNAVGTSATSAADQFTYTGTVATVTGLNPASGAQGTVVVITGTGFTGATSVTFGGVAATPTVNSDTQITVTAPAHAAGVVDVLVVTPAGTSAAVTADQFTYNAATATYTLNFRWSLITWFGPDGIAVDVALRGSGGASDIYAQVTAFYRWDAANQRWLAYFPGNSSVPGVNDFTTLTKNAIYWIAIVSPGSISWTVAQG